MELEGLAAKFSLYREISKSRLNKSNLETLSLSSVPESQDAAVNQIENTGFSQKLYKHISDYYAGEGNLSKETNQELANKDRSIKTTLSYDDPNSSALYSSYRTANFAYSSKARFITGVESAVKLSANIKKAYSIKA